MLDTLQSFFIEMPRGSSFCERDDFEQGYEAFRQATSDGADLSGEAVLRAIAKEPRAWTVLRSIVGLSPGEAAWVAIKEAEARGTFFENVKQADARDLDAAARRGERLVFSEGEARFAYQRKRDHLVRSIVPFLADVVRCPCPPVPEDKVHRFDKIDTKEGQASVQRLLERGTVPYSELLYERMLGRPYATHRDSVSDIVGKLIENAVQELLTEQHIDGRATRYREKVPGFKQAPDFLIPSDPKLTEVIIEAKLTEDDGTARDKAARVQALRSYENKRRKGKRRQIVTVIDGRGFSHRPPDLQRILEASDGQVYTLDQLPELIAEGGSLRKFIGTRPAQAEVPALGEGPPRTVGRRAPARPKR
ncbi:MAG TPA: hypothetical protein VK272_13050 [Solirubrobacteraceae bacterium]|nr:hypothetical protein [Solirubrobacteraceae bacterium]